MIGGAGALDRRQPLGSLTELSKLDCDGPGGLVGAAAVDHIVLGNRQLRHVAVALQVPPLQAAGAATDHRQRPSRAAAAAPEQLQRLPVQGARPRLGRRSPSQAEPGQGLLHVTGHSGHYAE